MSKVGRKGPKEKATMHRRGKGGENEWKTKKRDKKRQEKQHRDRLG